MRLNYSIKTSKCKIRSYDWLQARRPRDRSLNPCRIENLDFPIYPDRLLGQPSLLSNEYQKLFTRGVRRTRREADRSPQTDVLSSLRLRNRCPLGVNCNSFNSLSHYSRRRGYEMNNIYFEKYHLLGCCAVWVL
jgi:hypothetical protein